MNDKTVSEEQFATALNTAVSFLAQRAVTKVEAQNFEGTGDRLFRMYQDMALPPTRIAGEIAAILRVTFPVDESVEAGMVVQGPIKVNSMCPHHFLPVRYNLFVGYLPMKGGKVLGLSKLARIPELLSKRFVLQEQLAKDIADVFYEPKKMPLFTSKESHSFDFSTKGAIATLVGVHTCESCRGAKQDARTLVTERRGAFREQDMESRFYQAVDTIQKNNFF